ncbi:MAG TPA: hypothetical protein PKM25_13505 [Candidatus Ozemobacteraceae bacterium]|nr:hypothetical protein [Candidatus Ozemobacteraceae bacterium]
MFTSMTNKEKGIFALVVVLFFFLASHASFAAEPDYQPVKTLDSLAAAGNIKGVVKAGEFDGADVRGLDVVLWVERKMDSEKDYTYTVRWQIKKQDGTVLVDKNLKGGITGVMYISGRYPNAFPKRDINTEKRFYHKAGKYDGFGSNAIDFRFDSKTGNLETVECADRYLLQKDTLKFIFGTEREKFLFNRAHGE